MQNTSGRPILLDGAMGTLLQTRGLPFNMSSDVWTLEKPEEVLKVHQEYVAAGAQIIFTNTFGSSHNRLEEMGLANRIQEINETSVRLAREATNSEVRIAGCVGPIGSRVKPFTSLSPSEASAIYREQISLLLENNVDMLGIETLFNAHEIKIAAETALATLQKKVPLLISMTVNPNEKLACGSDPVEMALYLEKQGVNIVGLNCSFGPESIWPVFEKMKNKIKIPIAVKPNAFGRGGVTPPLQFNTWMQKFIDAGANFIGGCCQTTPMHISQLRGMIQAS